MSQETSFVSSSKFQSSETTSDEPSWRLRRPNTKSFPSRYTTPRWKGPTWPIHDLLATRSLAWILPSNMTLHLVKCVSVTCFLVGLLVASVTSHGEFEHDKTSSMSWNPRYQIVTLALSIVCWIYWYYQGTLFALGKPWMDPSTSSIRRMEMHVPLRLFQDSKLARRAACLPQLVAVNTPGSYTPNVLCLDNRSSASSPPTSASKHNWEFQLLESVEEGLDLVVQEASNSESTGTSLLPSTWSPITVPGHWMLQGFKDIPIYTNKKYPFPRVPPVVPRKNPTGVYKLVVDLPPAWMVDIDSTGTGNHDEFSILLHGFESACYVFWNSVFVGFGKDSRLPSEFAIPREALLEKEEEMDTSTTSAPRRPHRGVLHLVMARWSDGSYLEDQDHWWMAGLHRSVELIHRPARAKLLDYRVQATADRDLTICLKVGQSSRTSSMPSLRFRAQLFADKQLSPDGDQWKEAESVLWEEEQDFDPVTKDGIGVVEFRTNLPMVDLWTAETPNLYTLVLEQVDPTSKRTLQAESCRVGFRSMRIQESTLQINGVPITVCGINRHEHDPDHGKVVSLKRMKQDIEILKQNNFNSIRTCHYPTHSSFYRLCDYYGMYVCDEANVETDGMKPMGRLANDWGWSNSIVSRVTRMVQRDANHACIIMWSLGNESGRGSNFRKAREMILQIDNTRPICYEGGGVLIEGTGDTELTDVVCPMYPDIPSTEQLGQAGLDDRPVILCEYSHAMNNSNGNLHLYWQKFWDDTLPRLQGGFIWDMIDQGLRKRTKEGREFYAYGGDFGDKINDRQFCINGMFSPDRDPHPCVAEIKYLQQPAKLVPESETLIRLDTVGQSTKKMNETQVLRFKIQNRYSFLSLEHLEWTWSFFSELHPQNIVEGTAIFEDHYLTIKISPIISELQSLDKTTERQIGYLNIEGRLREDASWAKAGHTTITEQVETTILCAESPSCTSLSPDIPSQLEPYVSDSEKSIKIAWRESNSLVVIEKSTGTISSVEWHGEQVLCGQGIMPNFSRAATDNDKGGLELVLEFFSRPWLGPWIKTVFRENFSYNMSWTEHGLLPISKSALVCKDTSIEKQDVNVLVKCNSLLLSAEGIELFTVAMIYELSKDAGIQMTTRVHPKAAIHGVPSLARIGLSLTVAPALCNIKYFGRGPHENYPDRKSAAKFGLWKTSPARMGYPYIVPSENGNRSDCKWIQLSSLNRSLSISCGSKKESLCISALLHSAEELHHADHTSDLDVKEDGVHPIHINLDHRLMGLGGDVSWFPCVYPQYKIQPEKHEFM